MDVVNNTLFFAKEKLSFIMQELRQRESNVCVTENRYETLTVVAKISGVEKLYLLQNEFHEMGNLRLHALCI